MVGRPLRVLVVESDHAIAAMLARGLRLHNQEAEIVSSGAAALERLAAGGFDLVLLDLGLCDIEVLDVLRRRTSLASTIPVIAITTRSQQVDRAAALGLGVAAYLITPFGWSDVWQAIESFVTPGG